MSSEKRELASGLHHLRELLQGDHFTTARDCVRKLLTIEPGNPRLLIIAAEIDTHLGNHASAISNYESCLLVTRDAKMHHTVHERLSNLARDVLRDPYMFAVHELQHIAWALISDVKSDQRLLFNYVGTSLALGLLGYSSEGERLLRAVSDMSNRDSIIPLARSLLLIAGKKINESADIVRHLFSRVAVARMFDVMAPFYPHLVDDQRLDWGDVHGRIVSLLPDLPGEGTILDCGCGSGFLGRDFAHKKPHYSASKRMIGIDISEQMLNVAREKYHDQHYMRLIHGDMIHIMSQKTFTQVAAVIAIDVLSYVGDISGFIRHASGVLKPGGVLIFDTLCHLDHDNFDASTSAPKAMLPNMRLAHSPDEVTSALSRWGLQAFVPQNTAPNVPNAPNALNALNAPSNTNTQSPWTDLTTLKVSERSDVLSVGTDTSPMRNDSDSPKAIHRYIWIYQRPYRDDDSSVQQDTTEDDPHRIIVTLNSSH